MPLDLNMERNKKAQKLIRCDRRGRKKRTDLGVFKKQMSPLSSVLSASTVGLVTGEDSDHTVTSKPFPLKPVHCFCLGTGSS